MSFCSEEEGVLGVGGGVMWQGCEGREVIPPCSLNKLHDTVGLFFQLPDIDSGTPRVMEGRGFP